MYIYYSLFSYSPIYGYLTCFKYFINNSATMNNNLVRAYVHITRELASEYIPRSGIAKIKGNDINIYLLFCYIYIYICCVFLPMRNIPVSIPSNSVWECLFLYHLRIIDSLGVSKFMIITSINIVLHLQVLMPLIDLSDCLDRYLYYSVK